MSEAAILSGGLAGLYSAMQPRAQEAPQAVDLEPLREAAWEAGFAAGQASADAELAPLRLHLAEAAAALHDACRIEQQALRPVLMTLVRRLTEAVLDKELQEDTALLSLVNAGLALVRAGEVPTLQGHPRTLAALRPHLPAIRVVEDDDLDPDGFVITGADFIIDVNIAARLAEIMGELS